MRAVEGRITDSARREVYTTGGISALVTGLLLLIGIPGLSTPILPDNWLISIFKMHAGYAGATTDLLQGTHAIDVVILVLVGVTSLGLYIALQGTSRFWAAVAAVQPFLGVLILAVTRNAGRSAVMGSVLVASLVMLRSKAFPKWSAVLGIMASTCLLIGDLTAGIPPSAVMSSVFAVGYVGFIAWCVQIARGLWQMRQARPKAATM